MTFRRVAVSLRGPGQSPVLPFVCCVGSLCFLGHCGLSSCWCRICRAQSLVYWGCVGCGGCRLCVSSAQQLAYRGCAGCCGGCLTVSAAHTPPPSGRPPPPSPCFHVHEAQVPYSFAHCPLTPHPRGAEAPKALKKILLPSARHLEEGRGTTFFELLRRENCTSRLCPRPLGSPPPSPQHPNRVKNT